MRLLFNLSILKHEAYVKLRDDPASDWVFELLNPETYDVQCALYEDAVLTNE